MDDQIVDRSRRIRTTRLRVTAPGIFVLILIPIMLAGACRGGADAELTTPEPSAVTLGVPAPAVSGEPRAFAMGFLAVPAALTEAAYIDVFDAAADHGDVLMIQRHVPWGEVASDAVLSAETEATIARETALLAERDLDLLFAIDLWDAADRGRLAGDAPGLGFGDPAVVEAYLAYVELIVERYAPRWIALAIDVDQFAAARPAELGAFQAAYIAAYRLVKDRAPETLAFVTFQFEDLQGLVPWGTTHDPQWALLLRFSAFLDLLAVSSFPSFIFPFQADIPGEYFSRIEAFNKPIALVPTGYASEPGRGGVTFGTASGQRGFVERVLREADHAEWELVIWLAPQDPAFASAAPYDLINRMGLRDAGGAEKAAWAIWSAEASRPWTPITRLNGDATGARPLGIPEGGVPETTVPTPDDEVSDEEIEDDGETS